MTDAEVAQLKEQIDSLRRELILRSETQDKALQIQTRELERRLENLNHEAERLKAMQSSYVPRESYDISHRELCAKVDELKTYKDQMQGKASQSSFFITLIISIIGAAVALASLFM